MNRIRYEYMLGSDYVGMPRDEVPVRAIWVGLKENTSAHGIPHIDLARGTFKKAMWSCVTAALFGAMIYHFIDIFSKYFSHPVNVNLKLHSNRELMFPAVTICNMNPVKRSVLESGGSPLADLLINRRTKKKKRKKRALMLNCLSPAQIHTPSGLCFGMGWRYDTKYDGGGGAKSICSNWHRGGVVMPNTLSKFNFIKNSPIFINVTSQQYWIGIKKDEWADRAPIDLSLFQKFVPGHPDRPTYGDCVTADRSNGHQWISTECNKNDEKHIPLCQQMIQCPWPVYPDPSSSEDICYFLFDFHLTMDYGDARRICQEYDRDAILAVIDTLAKFKHLITTGLFDDASQNKYWMYLKNDKWKESYSATWTNWHPSVSSTDDCAIGHINDSHQWTNEDCSSAKALTLCEWRDSYIPYVPYVPNTTVAPDTTIADTTEIVETTYPLTSVIATTDPPTTYLPTTDPPMTDPPTTDPPTTDPPTTDPPTTDPPTTDPPTTDPPTTDPPTTDPPTTDPPTTVPPTTDPPTTDQPTTDPPTTDPPTTVPLTTDPPTTDPPTTDPPTTDPPTTVPPTTDPPTTNPPTTDPPTTDPPTTDPPTTDQPTTDPPTTDQPTTDPPTTDPPTTDPPTTDPPTTDPPTTDPPTSDPPTTDLPTTEPPSTNIPSTDPPTTDPPTTVPPTTDPPTTVPPTTVPPTTDPSTIHPTTTDPPTTYLPTTDPPTTEPPTTDPLTTDPPTTDPPTTNQPTTDPPTTVQPTTDPLTTNPPTTIPLTTDRPTTVPLTTDPPTTDPLTTDPPTTKQPSTDPPTTLQPTTDPLSTNPPATDPSTTDPSSPGPHTTDPPTTSTSATTTTTMLPPTTTTRAPTTTPPPGATAPPPSAVPGSQFPERVQIREEFQTEEKAIEVLANIAEEAKIAMGYNLDEFLLDCQYNGYLCSPTKDFTTFYNGIHGNCYTFNSGWNNTNSLRSSEKTGRRYGLKVVVNIGQDEYTDQFGEEAGARVVLHPQDRMPFPEDEGILAKPGLLTSIGLRKVSVHRLSSPYGNCVDYDPKKINLTKNVFQEIYPVNYSRNACLKTCYQYYVITECSCSDPYYPKEGLAFPVSGVRACNPNNITQDDCRYNVTTRFIKNLLNCECPNSCKEYYYMPSASTTRWPSDVQVDFVLQAFRSKIPNLFNNPNDTEKFTRNLLKLEVYYEELNYELISEKAAYGVFQFLSDIGGTLGLWLGFSLMTTFEFIEFMVDLLVYALVRGRKSRRPGPPSRGITQSDIHLEDLDDGPGAGNGGAQGEDGTPTGAEVQEEGGGFPDSPPPPYTSQTNVGNDTEQGRSLTPVEH